MFARCVLIGSRIDLGKLSKDKGNFSLSGARSARNNIYFEEIPKYEVMKTECIWNVDPEENTCQRIIHFGEGDIREERLVQHQNSPKSEEMSES